MSTKQFREVREIARERGWKDPTYTNGGHIKILHPNKDVDPVFASVSPSDNKSRIALITEMKRAERAAGLHDQKEQEETVTKTKQKEKKLVCEHCNRDDFRGRQGLVAHENNCSANPDVWRTCPDCGQICKGPVGLTTHQRYCKGAESDEPDDEAVVEETEPETKVTATVVPASSREQVRGLLMDLLGEYDRLSDESDRSFVERMRSLGNTLEATTDMIIETVADG